MQELEATHQRPKEHERELQNPNGKQQGAGKKH